jgi:hypothetical protein
MPVLCFLLITFPHIPYCQSSTSYNVSSPRAPPLRVCAIHPGLVFTRAYAILPGPTVTRGCVVYPAPTAKPVCTVLPGPAVTPVCIVLPGPAATFPQTTTPAYAPRRKLMDTPGPRRSSCLRRGQGEE